jgi:hypothetical protein
VNCALGLPRRSPAGSAMGMIRPDNSSELRLGLAEAITGRLSDGHDPSRRASTLPEEHLVSVGGVWLRWSVGPFLGRIDPCAQIHARALAATSYGILTVGRIRARGI